MFIRDCLIKQIKGAKLLNDKTDNSSQLSLMYEGRVQHVIFEKNEASHHKFVIDAVVNVANELALSESFVEGDILRFELSPDRIYKEYAKQNKVLAEVLAKRHLSLILKICKH